MSFEEYPKVMVHPNHKAAVLGQGPREKDEEYEKRAAREGPAAPEKFPNITVGQAGEKFVAASKRQEEQYAAQGYVPAGTSDPEAYRREITGAEEPDDFSFHEYPKWKYHADEEPRIVKDAKEEAALGAGWADRQDLAMAVVVPSTVVTDSMAAPSAPRRKRAQASA